jgi:hypothetical protein
LVVSLTILVSRKYLMLACASHDAAQEAQGRFHFKQRTNECLAVISAERADHLWNTLP